MYVFIYVCNSVCTVFQMWVTLSKPFPLIIKVICVRNHNHPVDKNRQSRALSGFWQHLFFLAATEQIDN